MWTNLSPNSWPVKITVKFTGGINSMILRGRVEEEGKVTPESSTRGGSLARGSQGADEHPWADKGRSGCAGLFREGSMRDGVVTGSASIDFILTGKGSGKHFK